MKVKINEKLLCIPPYLSTTWDQVTFLQSFEDTDTRKFTLSVHLSDGKTVEIPQLDPALVDIAFSVHMKHLENRGLKEQKESVFQQLAGLTPEQVAGMPIRFGIGGIPGIDGMETVFQHNSTQAESPNLPKEVLEKVAGIARLVTGGDLNAFPKPEPHCNCMHCQLSRAIHGTAKEEIAEEPITEEDLKFRSWEIHQSGDQLYNVINPLDPREKYSVYLGAPLGCTCGESHCEHIKAVLYS